MMEAFSNPNKIKFYKWTYRWFIPGFDDEIYWDTITVEWLQAGTPSESFIREEIRTQKNISYEDLNLIQITGYPEIEEIN